MKKKRIVKKLNDCKTVGVRFGAGRVYTYRVKRTANVKLGDQLIAQTPWGPKACFVVRIDSVPTVPKDCPVPLEELVWITEKVVEL